MLPGEYTRLRNHTYVPQKFRCMQIGVTWSPDMAPSTTLTGDRDEVVLACQEQCHNMEGCKHFTIMFPGLCRFAGEGAAPLPAPSAVSGPPLGMCDDMMSDAPFAHTFMRKYVTDLQPPGPDVRNVHNVALGTLAAALATSGAFAVVMVKRTGLTRSPSFRDEEEALTASQE